MRISEVISFFFYHIQVPTMMEEEGDMDFSFFGIVSACAGAAVLITTYLMDAFALASIQRAEDSLSPRIGELLRFDKSIKFANLIIGLFIVFSFLIPFILYVHPLGISIAWFLLLVISLILLNVIHNRNLLYINPFAVASQFAKEAKKCIKRRNPEVFTLWVDALAEIVVKALQRTSTSLANQVLKELETISCDFLIEAKSSVQKGNESMYYTLGYILQRFDFIHEKAIQEQLEPISSQIIIILGKIAFYAAQYDPEMATLPLHFLAKCTKEAQGRGFSEASLKASLTLQEVAKNIIDDNIIRKKGIKVPLMSLINHLEDIAKTTFKADKSTSVLVLMQPFQDLKAFLQSENNSTLEDREILIQDLDRIIGEFDALSMVLKTVPNIPGYVKGTAE
jgi:hypothetical protein